MGDLGFSLTSTIVAVYFGIFLIDVVGLAPGMAAFIVLIGRIWDWVNDPLIGYISDRTRSKWGRRWRPACLSIKSIAVAPAYWGRSVDALMLEEMALRGLRKGYRWIDKSLTEDTNPMTNRLASRLGAYVYKRYRVYRKELSGATNPTI